MLVGSAALWLRGEQVTVGDVSKLASLLQQGLLTRDEFERLKAKLIAKS